MHFLSLPRTILAVRFQNAEKISILFFQTEHKSDWYGMFFQCGRESFLRNGVDIFLTTSYNLIVFNDLYYRMNAKEGWL